MDDSDDFHTHQSLRVTRAKVPKLVCALESCGALWGDGQDLLKIPKLRLDSRPITLQPQGWGGWDTGISIFEAQVLAAY